MCAPLILYVRTSLSMFVRDVFVHTQNGAINAIARGYLPAVVTALVAAGIDPRWWVEILKTVTIFISSACDLVLILI